jgi:hypothetical protein
VGSGRVALTPDRVKRGPKRQFRKAPDCHATQPLLAVRSGTPIRSTRAASGAPGGNVSELAREHRAHALAVGQATHDRMLREARDRELTRRAQAINDELQAQARKRTAAANERNSRTPNGV